MARRLDSTLILALGNTLGKCESAESSGSERVRQTERVTANTQDGFPITTLASLALCPMLIISRGQTRRVYKCLQGCEGPRFRFPSLFLQIPFFSNPLSISYAILRLCFSFPLVFRDYFGVSSSAKPPDHAPTRFISRGLKNEEF